MSQKYVIDYIYAEACPAPWNNTIDGCCYWCKYYQGLELKKSKKHFLELKVICSFDIDKDKYNDDYYNN